MKLDDFSGMSVLIIDPADNVRSTIAAMLKELGFVTVEQAARLARADELMEKQQYDIIICEQQPPEVDGLALLRKIRANASTARNAFIIISASLDQSTVLEAVKSGVSEFIVKPFSLKTFKQRLKRAISMPVKQLPGMQTNESTRKVESNEELETTSILVVDDVPENIKVVSEVIRHDYQVRAATSGEKALKMCLSKNPPDMILLDIMMPEMDGLTVCKRLKSHPLTQHITIIFISAMDQTDDVVRGLELGAVDYITKPINPKILAARVKNHVKITRATKTLREQVDLMVDYAQLRSDFDRVVQKDMKKPLQSIQDNLVKLDVYYDEPRLVKETTQKLKEVCSTANSYVDNLAMADKIESKKYDYKAMNVNLVEKVREVSASLNNMANTRKIEWQINDNAMHIILAEDSLVRMTLMNLMKNAIEAAPDGSKVTIDFQLKGKNSLCLINNEGKVPEAVKDRFFEKYFSWEKPDGSGLGTYVSKLITELQDGKIWYESSLESGTTVFLEYKRIG